MLRQILVYALILALSLIGYFVIHEPIVLGPTASMAIIIIIALVLIYILVRTIMGNFVGRRTVFTFVAIAVILPFFMTVDQPIRVSPEVQSLYDAVTALKPGSKVLVSFDYDPPSAPELQPMAESFFALCIERDLKIIIMGLWPQGPQQADLAMQTVLAEDRFAGKSWTYGIDYVNLGFQSGNEFVIQRMGSEIGSMFHNDFYGTPYDSLPLVKNIKNFSNIDFSFNLSAGYPGSVEWVQVAVDRYGLMLGAGNTAVQAPQMYPYLRAGQLHGLLGGLNGAAEFEKITQRKAKGTRFMVSQSFSHVVVIAFIIIGNAAFFLGEKRRKTVEEKEAS